MPPPQHRTTPRHLTSLLVRLQHASAPELDDTLQKLLNYPDALDQVMQIVGSRIDAGVYIRNESLASLILRTCFSHLYEKVRERLLKDHWTALTLYKSQYPDPEIEKKLCDRLYKIASDDAQPLRRCIVDAMREVGSEAVLPTLEAILFDLEPSAIIRPSASDLLAGLEAKSRAEFLSSVALSIEDIKSRAASAAEAVGVVGTPEEPSRGPGPAPNELGTIFISYSRDSALHEEKVLSLSDKLRSEGIDCILDQYESSPPEGWPKWMDREIIKAKFVL
jgi:hypothetical protein